MPNWCVGSLKIRGEKEKIKRFLLEGLKPLQPMLVQALVPNVKAPEVKVLEDEWSMTVESTGNYGFHVTGTHRNFIESSSIEWEFDRNVLIIEDYKAAWGIDAKPLADLSEKFQLDFRIYAFEKGMEFNQEIEIHKGTIIKNNEITFDNYDWECVNPTVGG